MGLDGPNCGTCEHWESEREEDEIGLCHRYPPTIVKKPKDSYDYRSIEAVSLWPCTSFVCICGEWRQGYDQ